MLKPYSFRYEAMYSAASLTFPDLPISAALLYFLTVKAL